MESDPDTQAAASARASADGGAPPPADQDKGELLQELERVRAWNDLAQEAGGVGAYEFDIKADRLSWSPSVMAVYGLSAWATPTLELWLGSVHPDDRESVARTAQAAIVDGRDVQQTYRVVRPDGALRWIEDRGRVIKSATGEPERVIGLNIDVTELTLALEQKSFLMDELGHRIRNTLFTVQALARQTLTPDKVPADVRQAFDDRLLAMAQAHEVLTQRSWRGAEVAEVVEHVLLAQRHAHGRFAVDGDRRHVGPRTSLALTMVLHELCTNALKHGSLSGEAGRVRLDWRADPGGGLALTWREEGGPRVTAPERLGFGSKMLRQAFSHDETAEVNVRFEPEGLECHLRISEAGAAL